MHRIAACTPMAAAGPEVQHVGASRGGGADITSPTCTRVRVHAGLEFGMNGMGKCPHDWSGPKLGAQARLHLVVGAASIILISWRV